jgi:CO/xanthine dehydrogenase FAD-binding subunit
MKPAPFKYAAPRSLEEALALKSDYIDTARFLAGGQSLVPAMNFRLAQPEILIDLNCLDGLDYVREGEAGTIRIGALARHRALQYDPLIVERQPLVNEASFQVAHQQIRNRGTLCGNLAHADPASEMPAVMLALGARMYARSVDTDRWIEAKAFFRGVFETALEDREMLVELELPALPARTGTCFLELARRPGDYAMLGVAAMVALDDEGACSEARLAYCSAADTPVRAGETAQMLLGRRIDEKAAQEAEASIRDELDPPNNVHCSNSYRRQLAGVLTRRALLTAARRAGKQG